MEYREKILNILEEVGGEQMNRDDFKILKKDVIYFDNGATTLKPKVVRDAGNIRSPVMLEQPQ